MYISKDLCMEGDVFWEFSPSKFINTLRHYSDLELAQECVLLGECYRALEEYSEYDFDSIPSFLYILDSWRICLYAAAAERLVDIVLDGLEVSS